MNRREFVATGTGGALALGAFGLPRRAVASPGAGDSFEVLQQALYDAEPGDVIELGAGVYYVSDTLMLDTDDVRIVGAGASATRIEAMSELAELGLPVLSIGSSVDGVAVADLTIVSGCDAEATRLGEAGIDLGSVARVILQDCDFRDADLALLTRVEGRASIRTIS